MCDVWFVPWHVDVDDVPGISSLLSSISIRWDPTNRVVLSTERERRFLLPDERRSQVNEQRRSGPEEGLRGDVKEPSAKMGFLRLGDEPDFVSKDWPAHRP
jgi:hypothetical protein